MSTEIINFYGPFITHKKKYIEISSLYPRHPLKFEIGRYNKAYERQNGFVMYVQPQQALQRYI